MFGQLIRKISNKKNKYECCCVIFPQSHFKFSEMISNYIVDNFHIDCKNYSYGNLTKNKLQDINSILEKRCLFILGYLENINFENCYKLGLAHAYKISVILIDLNQTNKNCIEIPIYIKYSFIIHLTEISNKEELSNFLSKLNDILSAALSRDVGELLYKEAVEICESMEKKLNCQLKKVEKEEFLRTLRNKDIRLYFSNYTLGRRNLVKKVIKDKEMLVSISYDQISTNSEIESEESHWIQQSNSKHAQEKRRMKNDLTFHGMWKRKNGSRIIFANKIERKMIG